MTAAGRWTVPAAAHACPPFGWRPRAAALLTALLVAALFLPVAHHPFLLWDDPVYVTRNHAIADGLTWRGLVWAFTEFHAANWHPLTWLSHMLDVELWGGWAGGHHLSSVFWHGLNSGLLFVLLYRTTGAFWRCVVVALLFGVHPLHVESVAWIAERKDVLAGFFWLLTLLLYVRYARRPGWGRYLWVTASLAAGLMAKPMLVTLPVIMLLLDGWPLRRIEFSSGSTAAWLNPGFPALLVEKLPWLAMALVSGLITLRAQASAIVPVASLPWEERLPMATIAYATYLWQTVWPLELSFFYRPRPDWTAGLIGALATLTAASGAAFYAWRRGNAAPLVGWGWYLIALLPVIGIIKVGPQAHADRYTYLPLIGVFVALAFALPAWARMAPAVRRGVAMASVAILALAALGSWRQTTHWSGDEALYTRAIAIDPGNDVALLQLGETHRVRGNLWAAADAANRAMSSSSSPLVVFHGSILLGNIAYEQRQPAAALMHFQRALQTLPASPLANYNVGTALLTLGDPRQAELHFRAALRRDPRYSDALSNLGLARLRQGDPGGARQAYVAALHLHPNNHGARFNLARLELQEGRPGAARGQLLELLRREPGHQPARLALTNLPAGDAR